MGAITHTFVSAVPDSGVAGEIQTQSHWNANHSLAGIAQTDAANTFAPTQTFTLAPIFTDAAGTRTALGLATVAATGAYSDLTGAPAAGANAALSNLASVAINTALATGAGVALSATATAPAAITTAQAGVAASVTASPAVAGSVTVGAAAGGTATLTGGNAARLTSGNANGGNVEAITGAGIGTGVGGKFAAKVAGGGATTGVSFDLTGTQAVNVKAYDGTTAVALLASSFRDDGDNAWMHPSGLFLRNTYMVKFCSGAASGAAADAAIGRSAAGVTESNNGTLGTLRDHKVRNLLAGGGNGSYVQTPSMLVANLAAAATAGVGGRAFVTDALGPVAYAAVVGGGAVKVPVYSDGAGWFVG